MRHPAARPRFRPPLVVSLGVLAVLAWPTAGHAVGSGKWTPKFDWASSAPSDRRTAIHMMLLRGDGVPYHSRVFWYGGEPLHEFKGRLWGWNPVSDSCDSFPTTNFTAITPLPTVGYNVFCSGHAALADGRMLVAGGHSHETGAFGVNRATIHTTGAGSAAGAWDSVNSMAERRWYPTNTTLKDGRILVTAGFQHRQHRMFGGRLGDSAPSGPSGDTLRRWAPVEGGGWDPPVKPAEDASSSPPKPAVREGHAGVDLTGIEGFTNQTLIFGGKGSSGLALGDLWALSREDNTTGADYHYKWDRKTPTGSGPSERSEHSMVVGRNQVVIFGGRDGSGTAVESKVYRWLPGSEGAWSELTIAAGDPPSPRMGHIAIYNEMAIRENHVNKYVKRMIVYGGVATEGNTPTDTTVYELRFDDPSPGLSTWKAMTESTFTYAGKPGAPTGQYSPPGNRYWH